MLCESNIILTLLLRQLGLIMQQNEKLKKELQALREENVRLKSELSKTSLQDFAKDLQLKEEQLHSIYEFTHAIPWSYDLIKHKLEGPLHFRKLWTSSLPDSDDGMDMFLSNVHSDDRKMVKGMWSHPSKYPKFECNFRYHGDDGVLHYLNSKGKCVFDASGKKVIKIIGVNQEITEQQRIEKKLRLKEMQLRDVYELANIGVWSYNFESDQLIPSEELKKIWMPPEKNIKEAFMKRVHADDRKSILDAIKDPEKSSSFEYLCRVTGDDNNIYYLLCSCVIECNENGKAVKAHGITWDITEKKLHEKQTLQTENHLRSFFEKIGLGVWEYNIGLSGVYLSEATRCLLKFKSKNGIVKDEDFLEKIHFQDVERVKTAFNNVITGESQIYDCTYRMLRKDNQYVWVLSRGVPMFDNKARVHKIIGYVEDLSQSKRYNVIKERLDFMQRVADALPIPVYYKDMDGRYVGYNEAFREFITDVGIKTPNIAGSTILDVRNANNRDVGAEIADDEKSFLANPDKDFEKTYALTSSSGEARFIISKKNILYDPQNKSKYLVGGILDISEHEKTKAKARIHQEQLLLADKMKSLGVLIGGVAHEINNPNHFINMNVMLLQKMWEDLKPLFYERMKEFPDFKLGNIPGDKLEGSIDDLLFGIKDGAERIEKIIESLKAYMRNVPSDFKETFDLHKAIENVVFLLKNQMIKATNKFTIERNNKKILVKGVQQKIEQVIINVLQNACQALTSREQSIKIETGIDPGGKWAIIKIEDNGIGIESDNLNFVTDPFFTTKREIGGTGLGLSISSSILEEHEGRFTFSSEVGKGTVVEIILPLVNK